MRRAHGGRCGSAGAAAAVHRRQGGNRGSCADHATDAVMFRTAEQSVDDPVQQGMDIPVLSVKEEIAKIILLIPEVPMEPQIVHMPAPLSLEDKVRCSSSFRENDKPSVPRNSSWTCPFRGFTRT